MAMDSGPSNTTSCSTFGDPDSLSTTSTAAAVVSEDERVSRRHEAPAN